jgi:hypothetical protein
VHACLLMLGVAGSPSTRQYEKTENATASASSSASTSVPCAADRQIIWAKKYKSQQCEMHRIRQPRGVQQQQVPDVRSNGLVERKPPATPVKAVLMEFIYAWFRLVSPEPACP